MASKDSRKAHGALGKTDMLFLDPDKVVIVTDKDHALHDKRAEEALPESFIENLMICGVHTPVSVRKDTENGDTILEDGRKRTLGLREANKRLRKKGVPEADLHRLPALVKRGTMGDAVMRMIFLNEQRFEDSPSNKARKAARALDLGKTEEEVANAFGVSIATVKNMLKFVDAPAAVRDAADSGKITMTAAYKLAGLAPADAREKVAQLIAEAPRTPGKKRATKAAAKKARAILDVPEKTKGDKASDRKASEADVAAKLSEAAASNVFGRRSDHQIENAAMEIATSPLFSAETIRVVGEFAKWLLGEDEALDALLKPASPAASNAAE
jgi:ParB family transcriptional regulator, chromosome partitioning protein